ncbi:MAG: hypothetical protein M3297_14045, partial [Thermoproteota archaeon]|nr:hypothetical protein [Thermoproteota archaeon]
MGFVWKKDRIASLSGMLATLLISFTTAYSATQIYAETGKGEDVFKVIMTIFGVDKSKGDVVAIVTTNGGEASRVKFLDSEAPYVVPINSSGGGTGTTTGIGSGQLVEYVATFPNVTVNAGDEYKACVLATKDLQLICDTGNNSPASRPEFVDISLNATVGDGSIEQAGLEEG